MHRCLGCMREFGEEYDVCPYCGYIVGTEAASKNHLAPGTVLQDRYTLGKALGQGGFGITYIAWDNKIGRAVAIKEYMPNALASRMTGEKEISCYNEEARRQFDLGLAKTRKEAHALSQFGALESVVKVHDCIEENGTAYIVMELLRGRTVKEIIAERGRLSFAQTMRIMTPVLGTLDAMHGVGMIHRDVAPDNIFVCEDGKIKLLDFGAARVVSDTDEKTLSVMLKAGYAPVEQYSSRAKQGAFTDVYAACAAMYKMLTGETPPDSFTREKDGSDLKALTQTDVPQSAQETIRHGMALNAADRIGSARELLDALRKDAPENVEGIDPKQFLQAQKKKQTKKIARAVIAAALVVCIVLGAVTAAKHFKKTAAPTESEQTAAETEQTDAAEQPETTAELKTILTAFAETTTTTTMLFTETTTTTIATTTTTEVATQNQIKVSVGDVITFGVYEQDNNSSNGKEAIEWIVLDKQDGNVLVISKYALDCQKYNKTFSSVTWESCSLRTWLNGTFLNSAFSTVEQARIRTAIVTAEKNPSYGTDPGKDTQDKVFLLSITEARNYFLSDSARQCTPTAYAIARGAHSSNDGKTADGEVTCWWGLRSPGDLSNYAADVKSDGSVNVNGDIVNGSDPIRPALWINLEL